MKKIAAASALALAVTCLFASSARAATEPPCDTVCGCTTGCARGCTEGGKIITCGVYGDCHTICIHFAAAAAEPGFLPGATPASQPEQALPWAPACRAAAPSPAAPAR